MAVGNYIGKVVGGDYWEIEVTDKPKMTGFSYRVLVQSDVSEKTGLSTKCSIVNCGTTDKQFDEKIKDGAEVVFDGEFQEGYNGKSGKMKYSNLKLKGVKK